MDPFLILLVVVWLASGIYLHVTYWRFLYRSKNSRWLFIRIIGYSVAPFMLSENIRQRKLQRRR